MKDNFLTDSFITAGRPPLGSGIKCTSSPHFHPSRPGGASLCKDVGPGEIFDGSAARPETHTCASYSSSRLTEITDERKLLEEDYGEILIMHTFLKTDQELPHVTVSKNTGERHFRMKIKLYQE